MAPVTSKVVWMTGDSPSSHGNQGTLGIPHPVTSARRCSSLYKVPVCCPNITKIEICRHTSVNTSIKFNENPFSCPRIITCGQMDGRTDRVKLIGTFVELLVVNAPDSVCHKFQYHFDSVLRILVFWRVLTCKVRCVLDILEP
jgi:hypothetical protein